MKDKLLLIFNEPAGIPHIGSVQLGDADIHSNLTDYIEKIYNYDIIKLPRGYDIFSIKPTKDINRGANTIYVLNTCL